MTGRLWIRIRIQYADPQPWCQEIFYVDPTCSAAHCANAHLYGSLAQRYEMRMPEGEGTEAAEAGRGHECLVDDQRSSGQGSARLHSRHILNYFFPKSLI